jgi:hypothetical protein
MGNIDTSHQDEIKEKPTTDPDDKNPGVPNGKAYTVS